MSNNQQLPVTIVETDIKIEEISEYEKYAKELKTYLPDLPKVDLMIKNYTYEVKKIKREYNNIPNIATGVYYQLIDGLGLSSKKNEIVLKDVNYHFKAGSSTLVFNLLFIKNRCLVLLLLVLHHF